MKLLLTKPRVRSIGQDYTSPLREENLDTLGMYAHHLQTFNSIRGPLDKAFLSRFFLAHLHI